MDLMVDLELNELRREFLREAKAKAEEMGAALRGGMPAERRERIAYLAHQLKGSGGSYGFQPISNQAAEVERLVTEPSSADAEAVRQSVSVLTDEIDRCVRGLEDDRSA